MVNKINECWIDINPIYEFSNIELIDELLRRGYSVTVKKEEKKPDLGFI
jgi:hypothetical protein